jgi:hypothetical protein
MRRKKIAEQMADLLRTEISEIEAMKRTSSAPKYGGARLALLRRLLADLESPSHCHSDVESRDWNGWRSERALDDRDNRVLLLAQLEHEIVEVLVGTMVYRQVHVP